MKVFKVYHYAVKVGRGPAAKEFPALTFDPGPGRGKPFPVFGELTCPDGTELYKPGGTAVYKLKVPKAGRPGEFWVFHPGQAVEEAKINPGVTFTWTPTLQPGEDARETVA